MSVDLSLVIPVFNASKTITQVIHEIESVMSCHDYEVILVNDGSSDDSQAICAALAEDRPDRIVLLQLSRNFGEHNAVLAGLRHSSGEYVGILDDDGQNRPQDILRMLSQARQFDFDVVYARYLNRQHSWFRILLSWLNDKAANLALKKPPSLYLSSFKLMSRLVVDELCKYSGPNPYIDGLVLGTTQHIGQIDVEHRQRLAGRSGYTLPKLVGLWMNMLIGFSTAPLRIAMFLGIALAMAGSIGLTFFGMRDLLSNVGPGNGVRCIFATVILLAGVQLIVLGTLGEYIGRALSQQHARPQFVIRHTGRSEGPRASDFRSGKLRRIRSI